MPKKYTPPDSPPRQREDGEFNRRYAVPVTLVASVFLTWLIIVLSGFH